MIKHDDEKLTTRFGQYYFQGTAVDNLTNNVSMSQNIFFETFTLLISAGMAHYSASLDIRCWGNQYAYMELIISDFNDLRYEPIYLSEILRKFYFYLFLI